MCQNTNIPRFFLVLRNGRTENTSNCDENTPNEERPSLAKFDVTKAAAKSPALQKTCEMLSSLQTHEYEQMRMEV